MKIKIILFIIVSIVNSEIQAQTTFLKDYGTEFWDSPFDFTATPDGGYLIVGSTENILGNDRPNFYAVKVDGNGDTIWTKLIKQYDASNYLRASTAFSVVNGNHNNYLVAYDSIGWFGIMSLDQNGMSQWSRTIKPDTLVITYYNNGRLIKTNDNGFAGVGFYAQNGLTDKGQHIFRLDQNYGQSWLRTYSYGIGSYSPINLFQTNDNGFIVTGQHPGTSASCDFDSYIEKFNSNGQPLWNKDFQPGEGFSVIQTSDGGYAVTGYYFTKTAPYKSGTIVIKTDANGDTTWVNRWERIGTGPTGRGNSIIESSDGNFIITGYLPDGSCIAKLNSNGQLLWSRNYGDHNIGGIRTFEINGGYAMIGEGAGTHGKSDYILVKMDQDGNVAGYAMTNINEVHSLNSAYIVYPNPAKDRISIQTNSVADMRVEIYDISGKMVHSEKSKEGKNIKISHLSTGTYFIKIFSDDFERLEKFVIQK